MKTAVIALGAVVGAAVWAVTASSNEDTSVFDPLTDFMDTWDMTNSGALQSPNVRAFLALIRKGEGTADQAGYSRLVGGGQFSSFADHPRQRIWIARINDYSTAAGAYQILKGTWAIVRAQAGLSDFTPESQDIAAVQLIRNRGALADVIAGRIDAALRKCSYEWASLPPWRYSKQGTLTIDRAISLFTDFGGSYVV